MTTGSARWLRLRTAAVGACAMAAFGAAFLPAQNASATQLDFSQHGVTAAAGTTHTTHGTVSPTAGGAATSVPASGTSVDTKPVHDHPTAPGQAKLKSNDGVGAGSRQTGNGSATHVAATDTTTTTTTATTTANAGSSAASSSTSTRGKSAPTGLAKGHGSGTAAQPPKSGSPASKAAAASRAATHRKATPKAPARLAPQTAFTTPLSDQFSSFAPVGSQQVATPAVKAVAKPAAKPHRTIAQSLIPNEGAVNAALRRVQTLTEGVFSGPGLIAALFAVVIAVAGAGAAFGATRRSVS